MTVVANSSFFKGGVKTGGHAYWRVRAEEGGGTIALNDVKFNKLPFSNSPMSGGVPISDSDLSSDYAKANAFDGDPNSAWASNTSPPTAWIGWHFDVATVVTEIKLTARPGGNSAQMPTKLIVEYSDDGATWHTACESDPALSWHTSEVRCFYTAVPLCRLFRLRSTAASHGGDGFMSINELIMKSAAGGKQLCIAGSDYALSINSFQTPEVEYQKFCAFDGDINSDNTYTSSNTTAVGAFIGYVLPAGSEVVEYTIWPRVSFASQCPTNWVFEYSDNGGATYTTIDTQTGIVFVGGTSQTFATDM